MLEEHLPPLALAVVAQLLVEIHAVEAHMVFDQLSQVLLVERPVVQILQRMESLTLVSTASHH
jgi:hypothetical protein